MKISLYLENNLVELGQDIDMVLNKQFADLTDLTSIIVDYSKTIKVPMTARNNELFNYIFKLDHMVLGGATHYTYDPSKRIDMKLQFNEAIAIEGYAILNSVSLKEKTYEINIFGQLGKIFSELKEKTIGEYNPKSSSGETIGMFKTVVMNTDNIKLSFANSNHSTNYESTNWTDFFGFAPQLYGKTDILDTKTQLCIDTFVELKTNIMDGRGVNEDDAKMLVGDGFDLNGYGEIRSYMTRPYVYVDKLVQLVVNEVNEDKNRTEDEKLYGDYTFKLDTNWFSPTNPYYSKLCYFPATESLVGNEKSLNESVILDPFSQMIISGISDESPQKLIPSIESTSLDEYSVSVDRNTGFISFTPGSTTVTGNNNPMIKISTYGSSSMNIEVIEQYRGIEWEHSNSYTKKGKEGNIKWAVWGNHAVVPFKYLKMYDQNNTLLAVLPLINKIDWYSHSSSGHQHTAIDWQNLNPQIARLYENYINYTNYSEAYSYNYYSDNTITGIDRHKYFEFNAPNLNATAIRFELCCDHIQIPNYGGNARIKTANAPICQLHEIPFTKYLTNEWNNAGFNAAYVYIQGLCNSIELYSGNLRSGSEYSIYSILGDDFNPFVWLINYCKKFHLLFDVDYVNKVITITNRYFDTVNYKKVNIDYSKDVIVEPIVEKYKYVEYGYKNNGSKKGKLYAKKFKAGEYGDWKTPTGINITNEILDLTPDKEESVMTPIDTRSLTYSNLVTTSAIEYSKLIGTDHIINTLNDKNQIEYYPFYCFRWTNNARPKALYISDDSAREMFLGKYTLHKYSDMEKLTSIPQFDNWYRLSLKIDSVLDIHGVAHAPARLPSINDTVSNNFSSKFQPEISGQIGVQQLPDGSYNIGSGNIIDNSNITVIPGISGDIITAIPSYLYWSSFVEPKEVYNGAIGNASQFEDKTHTVYKDRWEKWLNELFDINNKKVTCYVQLDYSDFANFKFNTLFNIEGNLFIVNKIIDFSPNDTDSTKVELIQINNIDNLK